MKTLHFLRDLLPLLAAAEAFPSGGEANLATEKRASSLKAISFFDTFDNRAASPVTAGPTSAAGVFGAIDYKSFSLSADTVDQLVPPPSPPNFIDIGIVGESTTGEHQLLPANSTVKYFNLESLAYACTIETGLTPASCTIQLAALRAPQFGGETFVANLVFDAAITSGGLVNAFNTTSFPATFTGLVSVTVNVIDQAGTADLALFDNVRYVAFIEE